MHRIELKHFAVRARSILSEQLSERSETEVYRWFIRFIVLRYMELNGLLPQQEPLFPAAFLPQEEAHFRKKLNRICRTLHGYPMFAGLFDARTDCSEFRKPLLTEDGFLAELLGLPVEDWLEQPEVMGWLHQYYHTQQKDEAFLQLRSNVKIAPELIPAATQTFTPDWLIRYMSENALGSLWKAMHPSLPLPENCRFYLEEAAQSAETERHLEKQYAPLRGRSVTSLTVLDPCMGTGHILACVFDLLMQMYLAEGYASGEAARSILRNNLHGLDIDGRAAELAALILLMKAGRYDRTILQEAHALHIGHFSGLSVSSETLSKQDALLAKELEGCESFGSLLRPRRLPLRKKDEDSQDIPSRMRQLSILLSTEYDAVITNPPYMGSSNMHPALSAFVKQHYPDSKSDLFAAFMERCAQLTAPHGCFAMVTQHAWMFLSSYKALRKRMEQYTMRNMAHLGPKAFAATDVGTIVRATAFVCMGSRIPDYRTTYLRLADSDDKEGAFFDPKRRYLCSTERFRQIPGQPLCYWISDGILAALRLPKLSEFCRICQGMTTSDNKRFLRFWFEVPRSRIGFGCRNAEEAMESGLRWFPYNKGGKCRKWYGNHLHVVNYYRGGEEMRAFHSVLNRTSCGGRIKNADCYFLPSLTWQFIAEADNFSIRYQPEGFLFDVSGSSLFPPEEDRLYLLGLLSSCITRTILELFNPTMNFQVENLSNLPVRMDPARKPEVEALVRENIAIAQRDWDQHELSWDFTLHPLAALRQQHPEPAVRLTQLFAEWKAQCEDAISAMRRNEEALNRIFLEIYGLEGELSPEITESSVTLRRADKNEDLRSLISFGFGCLFGRYRTEGFVPRHDPSALLLPEEAAAQFTEWLAAVFGEETLEENLAFLTSVLTEKETPQQALRHYFRSDFYSDHCRIYRHRPIYWLADSGKHRFFRGYMYVHGFSSSPLPEVLRAVEDAQQGHLQRLKTLHNRMDAAEKKAERTALRRETEAEQAVLEEFAAYEDRIAQRQSEGAAFDPDAGIHSNHQNFHGVFAAIR